MIAARVAVMAIAIVTIAVALGSALPAAATPRAAGAPCQVAAPPPVHEGALFGGRVNGKGSFYCAPGQKLANFAVIVELKTKGGTRWVRPRVARRTYPAVAATRRYSLAKSVPCFPASYRTRAVLTVGGRTSRAVSAVSRVTCAAAPGYGASCNVEAQTPALVNGQAVGTGTVNCSQSGPLAVNLELELFLDGRWNPVGEFHKVPVDAHGGTTYTFTTPPFSCPPTPEQYRTVMSVSPLNTTITKTSAVVALNC